MKRKATLFIITIFFPAFLQAQPEWTEEEQDVQQAVIRLFENLSKRDSAGIKSNCTADVSFYEYGQIWNLDTLIHKAISLNTTDDFKRVNTFDFITTEADKNTAWGSYRLRSVITKDGKETTMEWLETVVLMKQGLAWKVKHLHSSLLKKS